MNKPKRYPNKSVQQLLKLKRDLQDDHTFCHGKADEFGHGSAADFYRRRAQECQQELERIAEELAHRGAVH